jgi:hypothetical protein
MKSIEITFIDHNETFHVLRYQLYNTRLANRWLEIIKQNQLCQDKYIHSTLYNFKGTDLESLLLQISDNIKEINKEYDILLPPINESNTYTDYLNLLHSMFEHWGDRIPELEAKDIHTETLQKNFYKLNVLIHMCEGAVLNQSITFPRMSATLDYYPQTIFLPIESLDLLSVTDQHSWGQLYLGYNTLGKDWLSTCGDNDIDLLNRETVRPQKRFAAESWCYFGPSEPNPLETAAQFESWYYSLPIELQAKVPIDNLSAMVLGRFLIGEVAINDYFLNYEPYQRNWRIPNSACKRKWNDEVFTTFKKITRVKIL